jgi:hypothetical protein
VALAENFHPGTFNLQEPNVSLSFKVAYLQEAAAVTDDDAREYEAQVREAQRMAENSQNQTDKAAWLRIAQQWLRLLRTHRKDETPQEDQSGWPLPRDEDSTSSH